MFQTNTGEGSPFKIRVQIIDDEELICWSLRELLEEEGYSVCYDMSGDAGLRTAISNAPDLIILDNKMSDKDGLDVLREIKLTLPETIVVMMTGFATVATAVLAMKLGAFDYITKPLEFDELKSVIERAVATLRLEREVADHRRELRQKYGLTNLIGNSAPIQDVFQMIHKVAHSEAMTVLLQSESGTGKDLVARAIHYESRRSEKAFVVINCATLPETLLESELFGHEKGAFTDAKQAKRGQFELADGGTIFLDEIGEMSLATQVKLLRILENRSFVRIGGTREIKLDVRIIAATNRDLMTAMNEGAFRKDLYYRLKVVYISIPPLRDRREDVLPLANWFITRFNREFKKQVNGVHPEAEAALVQYDWPGNVRELRNVIERAMILENDSMIRLEHLPIELVEPKETLTFPTGSSLDTVYGDLPLTDMERSALLNALNKANWNVTLAAKTLGISRDTMRYRIKKFRFKRRDHQT
jgi:DNA-binding NtrC family response regulator